MNHSPTSNEVFTDVRKAYRLLHDYQRMIMDSVAFIGKQQLTLSFNNGHQRFSHRPGYGSNSLDKWAWDWLGMYCYEFHFTKDISDEGSDKKATLRLSALHAADIEALSETDKTNTAKFPAVESSSSKICFFFNIQEADTNSNQGWELGLLSNPQELAKTFQGEALPKKYQEHGLGIHLIDVTDICSETQAISVANDLKAKLINSHPLITPATLV